VLVTDGPFAGTKEQLLGFMLARLGCVEVRAVKDLVKIGQS
jgi:hypothetical protein